MNERRGTQDRSGPAGIRPDSRSRPVVALVPNLFLATRLEAELAEAGLRCRIVDSAATFKAALPGSCLGIVDLSAPGAVMAISRSKADCPGLPILAFGLHVQADLLQAATHAGADRVIPHTRLGRGLMELALALIGAGATVPDVAARPPGEVD